MADLTTEYYWHCPTADNWSKAVRGTNDKTYIVRWGTWGHKDDTCSHGWSCTCHSYKYSKSLTCKHIESVKSERCGWMEYHDAEPAEHDVTGAVVCPRCGESVSSMGYGV